MIIRSYGNYSTSLAPLSKLYHKRTVFNRCATATAAKTANDTK